MKLLSRSEFPTLSDQTTAGISIGTARNNRVVYLIGTEVDGEQYFLLSKGEPKGFKFLETAARALRDAGFTEVTLTLDESAKALLRRELETKSFFGEVFAEFGSLRNFADDNDLPYEDVIGVIANGRRLRKIQLALAKHANRDPESLWPDFNETS